MASLFVIQGRDQGKRFELDNGVLGLGRDATNPVQLHDSEVSRRHAQIVETENGYDLVDLNSSNGSFVNEQPIHQHPLASGDRVRVGRTLLIFTPNEDNSSIDLAEEVDIIDRNHPVEGSRIIKAISPEEGGRILAGTDMSASPWLARARSNLQVMYRTALAVSHTLDIDQLLQRIMELIFEWVEADRGCIMLVDRDTDELAPKVFHHRKGTQSSDKMHISQTILDYVMDRQEGVHTSDARQDERWDPAASILKIGVREAICVPMQGRYDMVGVIYIDTFTPPGQMLQNRETNRFSEEHLKLMVAIGHQAALAVEDTSYYSAMVQAERLAAVGQTIATLSHHVKNILQGIRGGSYLIEEGLKLSDTNLVQKGWGIVEKNQEKISHLVMDMLTFSKERRPERIPTELNEVVDDVVELMNARAADANVDLVWKPGSDVPTLTFDPDAMHRAILNVVTNAIDACEDVEGGRIIISTSYEPEEKRACVLVEDNGEGIPPEDMGKIFSVFESRKGSRGTGLGLPVSQKILQEHGGDIRVESSPQIGSQFFLEFPAIIPAATPPPETVTQQLPLSDSGST
ncbi:MAG: FHA domain-containing protein [Planctomycetes bacterium]|nr:FHA domain-containing protein [Planctomycetota bacterium]MBL7039319.1 FHA domain-containing protein [Pirellulaceae bacterium]